MFPCMRRLDVQDPMKSVWDISFGLAGPLVSVYYMI